MTYEFCITTQTTEHDWMSLYCTHLTTKPEIGLLTRMITGQLVGVALVALLILLLALRCLCSRQRGAYRPASASRTKSDTRSRRWSSSSSSLLLLLLPLKQLTSRLTDADENVISSHTSLIRADM